MNNATINITSIVTKITGKCVTNYKLTNLSDALVNLDVFSFTGMSKQSKIDKYKQVILSNGFELSQTVWFENAGFEGKNSDVTTFNLVFVKRK